MVISSNNRSSSPMSMRPNPNSNPNPNTNPNFNSRINRESEVLGIRKSFSLAKSSINGQPRCLIPNTPANSPAEYGRRCSFGKEVGISSQDHEKENESDPILKPVARVRSPSVSKTTKNFMSPTISAVSKINPSPRKKVLGERNEAIRSSASFSEGKFQFYSSASLDFNDEIEPKEETETLPCSAFSHMHKSDELSSKESDMKISATDFGPDSDNFELEPDLVNFSPEVAMNDGKCSGTRNVVENDVGLRAKVDTCSSPFSTIAPLDADPSLPPYDPKTNFLSPRPQFLHYKPNSRIESYINQGIRLEVGFSSEPFSETMNSEEVQSDEHSPTGNSLEEKSSFPDSSSAKNQELEESIEHEIEVRPWFVGVWKFVCLIFFTILLGFTAVYQGNIFEEANGLLANLGFKVREVKFSPLPFDNLTAWQDLEVNERLFRNSMLRLEDFELRPVNSGEEIESKNLNDYEEDGELIQEFERVKLEENYEASGVEDEEFTAEVIEETTFSSEMENQEEEYNVASEVENEFRCELKVEDHSLSSLPQASDVYSQENDPMIETQGEFEPDMNTKDESLSSFQKTPEKPQVDNVKVQVTEEAPESLLAIHEAADGRCSGPTIAAAILVVMSLLGAIAFKFVKKSKKSTPITEKEKSAQFLVAANKEEAEVPKNQKSWGSPVEVDMMGESCPSEMSSLRKTSPNKLRGNHEAQSVEKSSKKNYKRESLASSSEYTMSSSYGSFTTNSVLHSKQRGDEVVTPVRRSNRIRSKATSP